MAVEGNEGAPWTQSQNTDSGDYEYFDPQGTGTRWAGAGRRQRHAQRQRARGAGMGALGEAFAGDRQMYQHLGGESLGMQRDMYGQMGALAGQMGGLAGQYQDLASGRGPSLAQAQLAQATSQNIANQQAMAAAGRGGNLAAQARQAQAAGAAAQMGAAQQAAQLRAQEQQSALAGLSGALQTQGGMLGQQAGLAEAMRQQAAAQEMGYADMSLQHQLGHRGQDIEALRDRRNFATGLTETIMGGGGGIGGAIAAIASDERVKENVSDGGLAASQAVGAIEPKTYEYKPGYGSPGQRVGPMAQDLEKTPAGAALVHNTPYGKMVDVGGMSSLALAASAEQQREIEDMKRRLAQQEAAAQGVRIQSPGNVTLPAGKAT